MQYKGKLRQNWNMLTDEDITRIAGRREESGFYRQNPIVADRDRNLTPWAVRDAIEQGAGVNDHVLRSAGPGGEEGGCAHCEP